MTCKNVFVASAMLLSCVFVQAELRAAAPVSLTVDATSWAVHEDTGRVFATMPGRNQVVEFSSRAGEVRQFKVGVAPTELIVKRDQLIVACTKSPALYVIDLARNKVLGSVSLAGNGPYALFSSQQDNPYVYAICNTGSAWWDGEVYQVDTQSMTVRKQVRVQRWGQSHPIHVAMSRDGNWIVPDARGKSSPSGADLMQVNEDECTFTQVRDYHKSFGPIVAGPHNRYWTFGNSLYTLDITKQVRTFTGSPVAIHPSLDLAVSVAGKQLHLEKFSDSSVIASVALDSFAANKSDATLRFDLKNNLVFVGTNKSAHWIDLDDNAAKLQPLRMLSLPSRVTTLVGKTLRIPISISNAEIAPKTSLTIADGPKSASIQNGSFVWSPTDEDIGIQTIQLEAKQASGMVVDSAELMVHVTLPTVDLGFQAKSMHLSPDGKHIIAWGPTAGQENRQPSEDLAVIDVDKLQVAVRKTLPQGIRCATIDDQWVYLSPNSGNLFYRLDHKLSSSQRQFLKSPPTQLMKISPDTLAVIGGQLEVFEVAPLKSRTAPIAENVHPHNQPIASIRKDTLRIGNRVVDYKSGALVRCLTSSLPKLVETRNQNFHNMRPQGQSPKRWGRYISGNTLVNHAGSRIAQWSGPRFAAVSQRWPVAISIVTNTDNQRRVVETRLELSNLIDGTVQHSMLIAVGSSQSGRPHFYGQQNQIIVDSDRVFVLSGDELIVAPIPKSIAEKMPSPTYFTERQPTEITVGGSKTVKLGVGGPHEDATFSLMAEYPGLDINPATGELTLDTDALWQTFIASSSQNLLRRVPSRNNDPFDASINAAEYKRLTGKTLSGDQLAVQLPISAVLRDREGQEDATQFSLIVLGSRKRFDVEREQARKKQEQQRTEAIARQQAEQRLAQERMEQARTAKQADRESDGDRLDRLEARVRRIEAALDSILKRLEDQ